MALSITIYEDTGPLVSGHGTTRSIVENIGWRSAGLSDATSDYVMNPVVRPLYYDTKPLAYSYKKYNYMKIEGTYPAGSRPRIKISGNINGAPPVGYEGYTSDVQLYYKLTSTYTQPNNSFDSGMIYLPPNEIHILYPSMSLTGPEGTQVYNQYLAANTTYFSQYLVTQIAVPHGDTYGNIGELNIEWYVDEYEDTNV